MFFFKKKKKKFSCCQGVWLNLVVCLLISLVVFLIVIGWGIYKLDWQNDFVAKVSAVVPYPALRVGDHFVLYKDYLRSLKTAQKFFERQKQDGVTPLPTEIEMKNFVKDRLIENILVEKIAKKYQVSVTSSEVDAKIGEVILTQGTAEEFSKFLKEYYNLSLNQYKEIFTKPDLLYAKTSEEITNDQLLNKEAKDKIEAAWQELKNGKSFEEVAKNFSQGKNVEQGGLIGNFSRGDLPKAIEDKLFDLAEGAYTEPVVLEGGWQILKVEKKDLNKGVLTLKTIFIKLTTLDDLLKKAKETTQIKIYIY